MTEEPTDPDFELIDRILKGEKDKYELLIRKYNQRLYRIAKAILWSEDRIEDAMQDAYIKAYGKLAAFEQRSSFSTWITRILINECLMKKRENKDIVTLSTDEELRRLNLKAEAPNPEKKVLNKELKNLLENAISGLPEKYRLVFVLREIENMGVTETGESLEISEGNVKARLSRAKEMLRNNLMSVYPANELLDFNLVRCDRIVKGVYAGI
ncbi:MAG TPA: RNA polymerase sigma factor [Bacteroidia bacterium]